MKPLPHILIDNCILLTLVSPYSYGELLRKLRQLVKEQKIVLIVPETLEEEWNRNKAERRKKLFENLSADATIQSSIGHARTHYTNAELENLKAIIDPQFTDIDNLLSEAANRISKQDYPDSLILNQQRNGKSPFDKKGRYVLPDAEIIYSALHYVKSNAVAALFFISTNSTDFSISQSRPDELHPDYQEAFPGIEINYFRDMRRLYSKLDSMGIGSSEGRFEFNQERPELDEPFIDRSQPILNQVYSYLKDMFSELHILPQPFFTQQYPFLIELYNDYHTQPYTLVTDNEELFNLLQVKVSADSVEDLTEKFIKQKSDEDKIRYILVTLRRNHISSVSFKKKTAVELTYTGKPFKCMCAQCHYFRLNWKGAMETLYNGAGKAEEELPSKLKVPYVKYQLGDFKGSAFQFEALFNDPQSTALQKYVCAFNLKLLSKLLRYEFNNESLVQQLQKRTEELDLDRVKQEAQQAGPIYKRIIEWIDSKTFYTEASEKIRQSAEHMRDLYYSENGGNVEHTRVAIETYSVTDDFLNLNYIIYNKFSEYSRLTRSFIEVLYSSYHCSRHLGGRLIHFPDYLVDKLVLNAHENAIRLFAGRYEVQEGTYYHYPGNRFDLPEAAATFLNYYQEVINSSYFDKNFYFNDQLSTISSNLLQFLQTTDLIGFDMEPITTSLLSYLEGNPRIDFRFLEELKRLLSIKGTIFPVSFFEKLLHMMPRSGELHHEGICHVVCDQLESRTSYKLSDELFSFVTQKIISKCPDCNHVHPKNMITDFCSLMNEDQKLEVKQRLTGKLDEKFDPHDYYLLAVTEVIDDEERLHQHYEASILEAIDKPYPRPSFFSQPEYTDHRIDQYLNYIFKFDRTIPEDLRSRITGYSTYYQWLLDPEHFNYEQFDTEWLGIHFTINYKAWFKKSEVLKRYMIKTLWGSTDKVLQRKFLKIFAMPLTKEEL